MLVRIWDKIHATDAALQNLIEETLIEFDLRNRRCDYCMTTSQSPAKHYALAILLCKLAGERCRNLEYQYDKNDNQQPTGYILTVPGGHSLHSGTAAESSSSANHETMTSERALIEYLENYNQGLFNIWQHFEDMSRATISARKKKEAPTGHSAGP